MKRVQSVFLSLRGGTNGRDAAIHRVSKDADEGMRFGYRFTVDRHGLRPRDDNTLCHCEEGTK